MKKLILLAGVAAMAACADTATEEAVENDVEVVEETVEAAATAPDGGPVAGSYQVTRGDETWITTINEDQTYTQTTVDGEVMDTGTMTMQDEDTACFDSNGDEEGPICYDSTIAEDGTWTSTGPDGDATVVRVES